MTTASLEDLLWIIPLVKEEFPHIKDPYRFMLSRLDFLWVLEDGETPLAKITSSGQ